MVTCTHKYARVLQAQFRPSLSTPDTPVSVSIITRDVVPLASMAGTTKAAASVWRRILGWMFFLPPGERVAESDTKEEPLRAKKVKASGRAA